MEYYSAITKNKITPSAQTWMDPEIVRVKSERKNIILFTRGI